MIHRLLRSADFERVLRTRTQANTAHFAVHHVSDSPSVPAYARSEPVAPELSTGEADSDRALVDYFSAAAAVWLGAVVPKRHARRSVTRTLLKRQIRAAMASQQEVLSRGLWVIRLRAPFDRTAFPSAASDALKGAARDELEQLLAAVVRRAGRPALVP
jgi:ribonuclease P protein component